MKPFIFILLTITVLISCKSTTKVEPPKQAKQMAILKNFFVYKTTKDYRNNVPVRLSNDGKSLVWFPDIKDVKTSNGFQTPILLKKGYLYDRQGINSDVAFLDYTYEQYAQLPSTPNPEELLKHILDNNPLQEAWIVTGVQYHDPEKVNELIQNGFVKDAIQVVGK